MRRYRRRRGTQIWMPVYGNAHNSTDTDAVIGTGSSLPILPDGETTFEAFACTFDYTESAYQNQFADGSQTLHDIVAGQEWKLLRVVGKVHAIYGGPRIDGGEGAGTHPPAVEFAAGLMVLRTDEEGNPQADLNEINPLAQESANDPWIWRRKWVLSSATWSHLTTTSSSFPAGSEAQITNDMAVKWPFSTAEYGSVADGPHVDQKTRRRIGREERLYWLVAGRVWDPARAVVSNPAYVYPGVVFYTMDNRFVGRLSSRMGNRNNASR